MYNENRKDINKDFPNFEDKKKFLDDLSFDVYDGRQPETQVKIFRP